MDKDKFIEMLIHAKYNFYVDNDDKYYYAYFKDKLNDIYYSAQFNKKSGNLHEIYECEEEEYSRFDWSET